MYMYIYRIVHLNVAINAGPIHSLDRHEYCEQQAESSGSNRSKRARDV